MNNFWRLGKNSWTWKALVESVQLWWYWETGQLCLGTQIQTQCLMFGIQEPRSRILFLKHLNQNRKWKHSCFRSIILVSPISGQKLLPQLWSVFLCSLAQKAVVQKLRTNVICPAWCCSPEGAPRQPLGLTRGNVLKHCVVLTQGQVWGHRGKRSFSSSPLHLLFLSSSFIVDATTYCP